MPDDIPLPRRRSIRLPYYDYQQNGAYFVTICALNRECLFGHIEEGAMRLNEAGHIAQHEWLRSAEMRREIALNEFIIMPNHLHGIVFISETDGARNDGKTAQSPTAGVSPSVGADGTMRVSPTTGVHRTPLQRPARASLGAFINGYKASVTKRLTVLHIVSGASVWQRNYYEHVIRNDDDLGRIRRYIVANPARWADDRENPAFLESSIHRRPPP